MTRYAIFHKTQPIGRIMDVARAQDGRRLLAKEHRLPEADFYAIREELMTERDKERLHK